MLPAWAQRISDLLSADKSKNVSGLARACGIKQGSVSGWLGKGKPTQMISGDNLVAAAAYLGVTPEFIMTGRNAARPAQSQSVRLDPEMLEITHRAWRKVYESEFNRPYNLEGDPVRFLRVYEFLDRLTQKMPEEDVMELIRSAWLVPIQGNGDDGRAGEGEAGLPTDGDDTGDLAGRVQRKTR